MGNINISTARTKAYAKEQRTMNNEHYSKQTQTNPKLELCSTLSEVEGPIPPPPSCAGKESRISERNAYPDLSGQHQRSRIQYRVSRIEYQESSFIAQNKANVKMGNITISAATTKAYANKQRTMSNERYSKQTQSNPKLELCSTLSGVEGPIPPPPLRQPTPQAGQDAYIFRENTCILWPSPSAT